MHGTQYAARQHVACERGKQLSVASIDWHLRTASAYYFSRIAIHMLPLAQQGQGLIAGIQSTAYHLRTFHDEYAIVALVAMAQLLLGEIAEYLYTGMAQ